MNRFLSPTGNLAKEAHGPITTGSGGGISRFLGLALLVVLASVLVTNLTLEPNKRNIEITAALGFLATILAAHPRRALYFTLLVVPYPAYTTVGSTSTLLILALAGLVMLKQADIGAGTSFNDRKRDGFLIGFGLFVVLSLYQVPSDYMGQSLLKIQGMLSAICLYFVIQRLVQSTQDLHRVLDIFCLAAASLYLIAFLQSMFPDRTILPEFFKFSQKVASMGEIRAGQVRVFATFPGYELFAEFVAITLLLQYLRLRQTVGLNARLFRMAVIVLGIAVLFATATRGGIIILALGWLMLLNLGAGIVPRKELLQAGFLVLAIFYLTLPFFSDFYSFMLERLTDLAEGKDVDSLNGRTEVFSQALHGVISRPFTGHGFYSVPGMFRGHVSMNIHNLYLDLAYKLGILGLIAFLGFAGSLIRDCHVLMRNRLVDPELRQYLLVFMTATVMILVDQFKIEFTRDPLPMHTTFIVFALTGAAIGLARRQLSR